MATLIAASAIATCDSELKENCKISRSMIALKMHDVSSCIVLFRSYTCRCAHPPQVNLYICDSGPVRLKQDNA